MSLNSRKRPGAAPDDINDKKKTKLDHSTSTIKEAGSVSPTPLDELISRSKDTRDLEEEEVLIEDESDEESEDSEQSCEEDYEDLEEKLESLRETDPEIFATLRTVQEELVKTEPNVMSLLKTPLRLQDKAKLCQYYEIYKSLEPNTFEWLESRIKYNQLFREFKLGFKQHSKYSLAQHEEMKTIEKELSSYDPQLSLKYKILQLNTSKENMGAIFRRFEDLQALDPGSEEYTKLKHWLSWATNIPHDKVREMKVDNITNFIAEASKKLDKELFGMKKVKEQILLFLSAKLNNPSMKHSNLGLIGPPGVGKTAIARMIAKLMNWGFEQISFGGVDKADFLKGHDYTYVGAQPGVIIKCLRRMGHKNGVIFLDEIEKAAVHPDIKAALLHLTDQSQNKEFRDNFLGDITVDLSHIWYIASMNSPPKDAALADRWWMIQVSGYTVNDKIKIFKEYLLPKILRNSSRDPNDINISKSTCGKLINRICKENDKGVRTMEKTIRDIVNKIDFLVTHQDDEGKVPFSTTFNMNQRLVYPVTLTSKILSKLIENKELSTMLKMIYL